MSTIINVDMLLILVQERPEIWDQRDANYSNRARKEAAWRAICGILFPDYAQRPHAEQTQLLDDVMRRWRSIRDQYRRERQMRARSGSAAPPKKRKDIYYDRLSFLDGSMDLRQTQSKLIERETGSDSEAVIDPVGVDEEVAGPSSSYDHSIIPRPTAPASQDTAPSVQDPEPPPSAAHEPASQEEQGQSSSPTGPPVSSPQASVPLPRGRRRREVQATRRDVDAGVLNYLSRAATDDGEETFSHSLARYLRPLPREVRLRVRGCMQILIDLSTPPNNPYEVFEFIERRQLSPTNLLRLQFPQQVQDQSGFAPPTPRMPPPQPIPPQNMQRPALQQMAAYNPHSQYGHFSRPSDVGWSQPGFGQHGHFGMGYDYTQYLRQQELQREFIYGQQPNAQYGQGQSSAPQPTASSQDQGQLAQQMPPEQDPELPLSPPPTYRDL
ncbi:uncharacterized protein LOC143818581 [Ranitomeya variabilis]|uniref:uncharacterized protein LOC143818581 n=1 Tax=Ranitomeya variabilis TaxID=490064 RepID=UPI004055F5BB